MELSELIKILQRQSIVIELAGSRSLMGSPGNTWDYRVKVAYSVQQKTEQMINHARTKLHEIQGTADPIWCDALEMTITTLEDALKASM